jgi:hypothetical protein
MSLNRKQRWLKMEPVKVRYIRYQLGAKKIADPLWECQTEGCTAHKTRGALRSGIDGVWCAACFFAAPSCSVCGADRPSLELDITDGVAMCRDCWQDIFGETEPSRVLSMLALAGDSPEEHPNLHYGRIKKPKPLDRKPEKSCYARADGLTVHRFAPGGMTCACGLRSVETRNERDNRCRYSSK